MRTSKRPQRSAPWTTRTAAVSWIGSLLGAIGALVLAVNQPWSGLGWYFFLGSNAAWIAFAVLARVPSLLFMQAVFTLTSLIGIYRWSI